MSPPPLMLPWLHVVASCNYMNTFANLKAMSMSIYCMHLKHPSLLPYRASKTETWKDAVLGTLTLQQEVVELLERGEMVLTASRKGDLRWLECLLRKRVGVHGRDQYGLTALHAAAIKGHRDAVALLADFGMDLECQDVEGHTPLHLAVEGGCLETVETLIDMGANVNVKTNRGATPLVMARSMGYEAISQLLATRGAVSSSCVASSSSSSTS
ncbi:hypothetical protein B296_00038027 [Ensete ventricosum]|uniref:Uncharacterized protein n=1 Tax=Ensete ventricosum TaxID=4639 RepID=A0A426XSM2_ENSVE|nr:hypothetical protein B296_00038027 [Ensete ventricosum]